MPSDREIADGPTKVVLHIKQNGDTDYLVHGEGLRMFVVDERHAHDRVYELTVRVSAEEIHDILGDSPIGNRHDARHKALLTRLLGLPLLRVVGDEQLDPEIEELMKKLGLKGEDSDA